MRFLLPLAIALGAGSLSAQDAWISFGQNASLRQTGNTVNLDYKVTRGQLGIGVLQVPEGKLAGMTHLQLRVKSDVSTTVAVLLSEKKPGGGDYAALFWSPRDRWQDVDLTPADFSLNDGPKDPKDFDGRLDLDQVQAVAIFDGGQVFNQVPADPNVPIAVRTFTGDHTLAWENFRIASDAARAEETGVVIDGFRRGFLTWFTPSEVELAVSKSGNPLGKPAMEMRYRQAPAKFAVVLHSLGRNDLAGSKELSFDVSSEQDAHLIVTLEGQKTNGRAPRYNHDFTVSAGQTGHMRIPFSEFTLADDSSPDPDGHLEVGHLRSIAFVDISGASEGANEKNAIWVADLRAR